MPYNPSDTKVVEQQFSDQLWRLHNLYYITNKDGKKVLFEPNWAQISFYERLWYRNVVLKARQLGMSTFINLMQLDTCLFNDYVNCGVIANDLDAAAKLYDRNIKFPFDHLPDQLRLERKPDTRSAKELKFPNHSSIRVATSMRGGTIQILHVSEFGKICAKYPEKSREIVTGSFEAVPVNSGIIVIESTAEGREGYFHEYCEEAEKNHDAKKALSPMDMRFHFFPWYKQPEYVLPPKGVIITEKRTKYFNDLEKQLGIKLGPARRAWYVSKAKDLGDDMFREYPSTPEEAFFQSVQGAYFKTEMATARKDGRICEVPFIPSLPVDTWWDIGRNDATAIWFVQQVGGYLHAIDYFEHSGEGMPFYAGVLRKRAESLGYVYGTHLGPHDLGVHDWGINVQRKTTAANLGVKFKVVQRVENKADSIEAARNLIPIMRFDREKCDRGILCLESYRKEWNEARGCYMNTPLHDWASDGSDAFQTGAWGRVFALGRNVKAKGKKVGNPPSSRGWT